MTATEFIEQTALEVADRQGIAPFHLWDGQKTALSTMEHERLAVFLKARQLGVTWVVCGFALWTACTFPNQTVLAYSQGQLEANELIRRVSFLYHHHRADLPAMPTDNTADLAWDNGSRMLSLAATRKAGRSFTASIAILDEWAFMAWPRQTLAAVKPTIDAGGKLFIISSADGQGSAYHQFWQHAVSGANGYKAIFLPWFSHPDRSADWREQKIVEASGDTASVLREYPANDIEAFTAAAGLVYDVWKDAPGDPDSNVTEDADYVEGAGPVLWGVDDGYSGAHDRQTGYFTANSAPRVILLAQERADGSLNVFAEQYRVKTMEETDIASARALGYPDPTYAAVDSASAALRGRLHLDGIYTRGKPQHIDESVKVTRRMLAPDTNGRRRIHVHPRCKYLRYEMAAYRNDDQGNPIDDVNHGPDALRYIAWTKRNDG